MSKKQEDIELTVGDRLLFSFIGVMTVVGIIWTVLNVVPYMYDLLTLPHRVESLESKEMWRSFEEQTCPNCLWIGGEPI